MIDTAAPIDNLRHTARLLFERYRTAPAHETETAIAVLSLWALESVEAGRLDPNDADHVFTMLEVKIGEVPDGPELSDDTDQLLLECMTLHDWGTQFSADPAEIRRLAFAILGAVAA